MSYRHTLVMVATACALALAAPEASAQFGPRESGGAFGGALIGGALGSLVGGKSGARVGGAIAGAVIGGFIGSRIGAALDEQDRQRLARETRASMEQNTPRQFTGQSGAKVKTRVTGSSKNAAGQTCRTVEQEVVGKDGQVVKDQVTGCKGPDGWSV